MLKSYLNFLPSIFNKPNVKTESEVIKTVVDIINHDGTEIFVHPKGENCIMISNMEINTVIILNENNDEIILAKGVVNPSYVSQKITFREMRYLKLMVDKNIGSKYDDLITFSKRNKEKILNSFGFDKRF